MMKNIIESDKFYQSLLDNFTKEELQNIINDASVIAENCIIISTQDIFFELSLCKSNLDIYCFNNEDNTEGALTKIEFMKLYKNNKIEEMHFIFLDE